MKHLLALFLAAAAIVPAAAGPAYRISAPSIWHEQSGTHVAGFVCRSFNLASPRPERIQVSAYDRAGRLVVAGNAPVLSGTLDARGVSCGHFSAVLADNGQGVVKFVITALGPDGRPIEHREFAEAG